MSKRIIIAPLDWGLGHATRCIPVIRQLLGTGHTIHIGGSGSSLDLLRQEFPELVFFELPAYDPRYSAKRTMVWKIILQLPKFIGAIRAEHDLIEKYVRENKIDLVISDNRYGCWSAHIVSALITHQSNILMPRRFRWLARWVRVIMESMINKFDVCLIPDFPDGDSLAGELISFGKMKFIGEVDYIGTLSRFEASIKNEIKYDLIAICSGPEPQRTLLEKILLTQLTKSGKKFLLVRGVIEDGGSENVVNYMNTSDLQEAVWQSETVIARSGYSTIMDLSALGKKAIFIPTPGQTEQEYLANRLKEKGIAYFMEQDKFDLGSALQAMKSFMGFQPKVKGDLLGPALSRVLNRTKI